MVKIKRNKKQTQAEWEEAVIYSKNRKSNSNSYNYQLKGSKTLLSSNFDDIEWAFFNITGVPDIDIEASAENEISGLFEKQDSYQELPFSVSNLPEFTSFAVKIIMESDNPAYVPKVQDLRAVASF